MSAEHTTAPAPTSRRARQVQDLLDRVGGGGAVRELAASTRTAADAASAIGCSVGQIAKSIVFEAATGDTMLLVIASGANLVDVEKLRAATGRDWVAAKASTIKQRTGFAIGGVPPAGHLTPLRTFLDHDLRHCDQLWAAAGTPHAVFPLTPDQLVALTAGTWLDIARESER